MGPIATVTELWLGNVYPTQYIKIECKESEVNIFVTCTYHSLHVCNRQALLCARLAAHCVNNIIIVVILYVNNILVVVILYVNNIFFCCYTLCKQYFCCYYALHVTNILLNFIPSGLGF